MPIKDKSLYPADWKQIRQAILKRAHEHCERCGVANYTLLTHEAKKKVVLTIAHLDHNPGNNAFDNLKALCQRCHLNHDKIQHLISSKSTRDKKRGIIRLNI